MTIAVTDGLFRRSSLIAEAGYGRTVVTCPYVEDASDARYAQVLKMGAFVQYSGIP